jgi:hypothetical protein
MGFSLLKYSLDLKFMYFHFIKNTKPKPNFFEKILDLTNIILHHRNHTLSSQSSFKVWNLRY